jgi:hypothetical protein
MCLFGSWLLVGSYEPFSYRFGGRHLCVLVGSWWYAVMCLSAKGLAVGSYGRFW